MDIAQTIWAALAPVVTEAAGIVAFLAVTWAAAQLRQRLGLEVTEKQRAALHGALVTGINAALARSIDGQDAVDAAVEYAHQSVPGAITALKPAAGVLESIAASKLHLAYSGVQK